MYWRPLITKPARCVGVIRTQMLRTKAEARAVRALAADASARFLAIRPGGDIVVDQTVSTE